jgi:hypothetical protein|tara:strand:- start:950 stop:1771 length:822 start_codon:yes stop_codon:yes gene_type:complete
MAVERVEINEPVEGEEMSLEDQLAAQEAAKAEQVQQEVDQIEQPPTQPEPSGQEQTEEEEVSEEKPDWLPEKFKTPEELAKAYNELEKERGKESKPKEAEGEENKVPDVSNAIQEASDAFYENGELSEENFKALEENGIPREFVEAYVKGQQATSEAEIAEITNSVGGQENYDAMIEWASSSLPQEEIESFDNLVSTGTKDAANMAVKGLYARYLNEGGGTSVNIAKGGTSKAAITPFNSIAQVTEAMRDKRYDIDPAYRAEVERRISVSTNI